MASSIGFPVRHPAWALSYQGKPITRDISHMVISVEYLDHLSGQASEMQLELEDRDKRWQGPWYPAAGDLINLQIGYENEGLRDCGDFQIDELELVGGENGDQFHLKCLSAWITPALRTPTSAGYETQTLLGVAQVIATRHGMTLVGAPDAINVQFARVSQNQETDLAFLKRIANRYNYNFTIQGKRGAQRLVFYSRRALKAVAPLGTVKRTDVTQFSFKDKTHGTYQSAESSYLNPATKGLITQTVAAPTKVATQDTLKLPARSETQQSARLQAQAALEDANMYQRTGQITMPGNTPMRAGVNITAMGFGVYDGKYQILTARHRLDRGRGYVTEIEIRSI